MAGTLPAAAFRRVSDSGRVRAGATVWAFWFLVKTHDDLLVAAGHLLVAIRPYDAADPIR